MTITHRLVHVTLAIHNGFVLNLVDCIETDNYVYISGGFYTILYTVRIVEK